MGSKYLKQLLNEDQEPFVLKNYINDKRSELNKPLLTTTIPSSENSSKNACFLSFHDSSEPITKSPLFNFSSQSKNSNPNTLFVHIPAKTAALLLESALRIQNQSEKKKKKSKSLHFGLFESILDRLRRRKKKDIKKDSEIKVSVKDILRWESNDVGKFVTEEIEENSEKKTTLELEKKRVSDVGLSCSSNSRVSSAWTESNEEKSLDLETSTTSSEETEFIGLEEQSKIGEFNLCKDDNPFPFQFILHNGSSPSRRSPELLSPATSPNRRKNQVVKNNEGHFTSADGKKQKEQKEQFSPVSVLDIQIGEDVEGQDEDEPEEDGGELERSFAFVQKAKQKLLLRLRRFEQLAELDPMELEKRIAEDEEDEDNDDDDSEEDDKSEGSVSQDNDNSNLRIREVCSSSNCSKSRGVPLDMKRLLIDLMNDERTVNGYNDRVKGESKLCRRWASMKDVERNIVKTMIEMEFRGERTKLQTNNSEHVDETVVAIELAIFGFLIEELSVELMDSNHLSYRSFEALLI